MFKQIVLWFIIARNINTNMTEKKNSLKLYQTYKALTRRNIKRQNCWKITFNV